LHSIELGLFVRPEKNPNHNVQIPPKRGYASCKCARFSWLGFKLQYLTLSLLASLSLSLSLIGLVLLLVSFSTIASSINGIAASVRHWK
jgi:hypothetical protein